MQTSNEAWRRRPLTVTVLDRCDECESLQPDVRERKSFWPTLKMVSCSKCFAEATGHDEGMTYFSME